MAVPGENIQSWSTTAATNAGADSLINWAEGQSRASVNNSARSVLAAIAKDRDLRNGSIVTTGTANAQAFISGVTYTIVPTGLRVLLKIGAALTNTGAATLNMDSIGAVAIKDMAGSDIAGNSLLAGGYSELLYNGTNWILISVPPVRTWTVTVITATNATWPVPAGIKEMEIEVWGGGAGGGGKNTGNSTRGNGGGGGGYCYKYYTGTMDATLAVTVGAGGLGVAQNTAGLVGGASTVVGANLGTLTAGGGQQDASSGATSGGAGGVASGGDINLQGGSGNSTQVSDSTPGYGGDSPRGGFGGQANVEASGQIPGGGGAGQNSTGGLGASAPGARGQVVIKTR